MKQDVNKLKNKNIPLDIEKLNAYINLYGFEESENLKMLRDETKKLGDIAIMQIGQTQGKLIEMLCRIGNYKKCIEIGVFTGYSSICIAQGMSDDGKLYAIDCDRKNTEIAKKYWKKCNLEKKITLIIDDGINALNKILQDHPKQSFDLVFIDADKNNYINYYNLALELLKKGGLMLIDNTIWKGKIFNDNDKTESTTSIRKLNDIIAKDIRVDHCLLTIYDGMTLCIKK